MKIICLLIFVLQTSISCKDTTVIKNRKDEIIQTKKRQIEYNTIEKRYLPEKGYKRAEDVSNFGKYLRTLKLKPKGSLVRYYNGEEKPENHVYNGVIDLAIGNKNLHQCADAIIRLRADYFYFRQRYDEIHFNLTNGFQVGFAKWSQGYRVKVEGNKTNWVKTNAPDTSYDTYWKYLEFIFTYAGTLSLSKELHAKPIENATIGDVLIQGGSPGHAILIIDEIINTDTGEKMFLLAQSYMPAQELQVLLNPKTGKSWYSFEKHQRILTPEWQFSSEDLKSF